MAKMKGLLQLSTAQPSIINKEKEGCPILSNLLHAYPSGPCGLGFSKD